MSHMARSRERRKKKGWKSPRRDDIRGRVAAGGRGDFIAGAWGMLLYKYKNALKSPHAIMICILAVNASYFCREHNRSSVYRCAASRNAIL